MTEYYVTVEGDVALAAPDYTSFHTFLDGFLMGAGVKGVKRRELRQNLPKVGVTPSSFTLPDGRTVQYWKEDGA